MKLVLKKGKLTEPVQVANIAEARGFLRRLLALSDPRVRWKKALMDDENGTTYLWGLYNGIDGYRWYEFHVDTHSIHRQCPHCGGDLP